MHKFKYVRMCSVTLVSVGLRFFSLMPKWFCKVKQLMACDISGWATVELGISGVRWQRCLNLFFSSLVIFFWGGGGRSTSSSWHDRTEWSDFRLTLWEAELHFHHYYTSLPFYTFTLQCFMLRGAVPGGRMNSLPLCPSAKSHLQSHYSRRWELQCKTNPAISEGKPG